jgi:hypothetical protein
MARLVFARGANGEIIRKIQRNLNRLGFDTRGIDGIYGRGTQEAVALYQEEMGLAATGEVDEVTWEVLMKCDIPLLHERCLQLTAAFQGHDFTLVQGNWNGQWLIWGIIGFTLKHGLISQIILEVFERYPELVRESFGVKTDELIQVMCSAKSQQELWANSISLGTKKMRVAEPWRSAFARFGDIPEVQEVQIKLSEACYFRQAQQMAQTYGLKTELGLALCFDIQVQSNEISEEMRLAIEEDLADCPPRDERELRLIMAHAVVEKTVRRFRAEMRDREMTIANGFGVVRGGQYRLRNWGIDEYGWDTKLS